ncbi:hypothetical protein QBC40DRAFT_326164 [Triangularia verruculosa]|uniref:Uncharacterized protein n=1 Tax=Triangularia verruculosa TaxID=2587418 RepID=A0AAN7AVD4_9PEZI|nr:hypothetical protein QBC40DRAFT_326164 [Triangularia verruculosa]
MKYATDHEQSDHKSATAEYKATTARFKDRFKEIDVALEDYMSQCRLGAEELRTTSDLFIAEITRGEARQATRQAEISKHLALVAMIYLPITAISTIFATPVFKFDNDWVDLYWNRFDIKPDNGEGSNDSLESNPPVVSGYFIIYITIGLVLTFVTVGDFLLKLWRVRRDSDQTQATSRLHFGRRKNPGSSSQSSTSGGASSPATGSSTHTNSVFQRFSSWLGLTWSNFKTATTRKSKIIGTNPSPPGSSGGAISSSSNTTGPSSNTTPAAKFQPWPWLQSGFSSFRRSWPRRRNKPVQNAHPLATFPVGNTPASNQASATQPVTSQIHVGNHVP